MAQTILYVEDNADNALMVQIILKREGFTVVIAKYNDIGLQLAIDHKPRLIIIDYHLPGQLKGPDLIEIIRNTPSIADTPIIMLTADTMAYPQSMAAGADAFLNKPIGREQLLNSIQALL